jgi:PhzF family phenazine biosynthesis protein
VAAGRPPRHRLTRSGVVGAYVLGPDTVEITQPAGQVSRVADDAVAEICSVLGITAGDLAPLPVLNSRTSRTKTLVPVGSVAVLDGLRPDFSRVERVCDRIGSTGLYPYAPSDGGFDARQFPRSSGYPEDPATGIAAAALAFGLLENGLVEAAERPIRVRQGRAMGRPSEISVRFTLTGGAVPGCRIGGTARLDAPA